MPKSKLPLICENVFLMIFDFCSPENKAREAYIRGRLHLSPRWTDGHLRLAETIVRLGIQGERPLETKDLSTLRISCEAAKILLGDSPKSFPEPSVERTRQGEEAELWSAFFDFFQQRHDAAKARFDVVLEEKNIVHLSRKHHLLALEYAALSALALGREKEAEKYVELIPESFRSRDMKLMAEGFKRTQESL